MSARTFRSKKIDEAQEIAYAKKQGWIPSGYVDKKTRREHFDAGFDSQAAFDAFESEGVQGIADQANARIEIKRTPYNPAKGLTTRYDPITGGSK